MTTLYCNDCEREVDADEIQEGFCPDCYEYRGAKYCCGIMYQDGEVTCVSCGEPI